LKPAFPYYGGKQKMAHNIIPLIPKHTVYCEPFCGGAAIFFGKPTPVITNNHHYRNVLNDRDHRIINFFTVLRDNPDELIRRLSVTPYSREVHKLSKTDVTDDPIQQAVNFYINIQQSFSNVFNESWGITKYGGCSPKEFVNSIDRLPACVNALREAFIECDDAIKVIKRWDSPQTFFYCDPPYPHANQGHYSGYTLEDLQMLVNTLDSCEGSFLLSNYEQPDIILPEDWKKYEFSHTVSAGRLSKKLIRKEVVWSRCNTKPVRAEIQKLYDSGKFDCFKGL
jgi:DNA adenine methylase